jgi:chromosome segregation ATPase
MLNLVDDPRIVGFVALLGGFLFARIFASRSKKSSDTESTTMDRQVRSLEADLRVTNKNLKKSDEQLNASKEELAALTGTLTDIQAALDERTNEFEGAKQQLRDECGKTNSLRQDLSGRAEETIRAEVHARQVEVELSVVKAGATAVHEEVDRLAAERQELTGRLRQLEDEFLGDSALDEEILAGKALEDEEHKEQGGPDELLIDF